MRLDMSLIYSIRAVWFVPSSDWSCFSVFYELWDGSSVEAQWEIGPAEIPLDCVHTNETRRPATGALLDVLRGEYDAVLKIYSMS